MGAIFRWLLYILVLLAALAGVAWWGIGPDWRALLADPPTDRSVLFWSQSQRDSGFRLLDRLPFLVEARPIETGKTVRPLEPGEPIDLDMDVDAYMDRQRHSAVIILQDGKIRLEKYGLGFDADGRWTSFSVAKSITSTLVGAAIEDGFIDSLDAKVTDYIPGLAGSPYDDVTIEQLLTMTSGVAWNEDYEDPDSDVARFTDHVAQDDLPTVVSYMRTLGRAHPPGTVWNYSTGETNLIGILVSRATCRRLADYASEKIWAAYGMEQAATWLVGADGEEISGCCIQAATRDFARFGQFILEGAQIDGKRIVPEGWIDSATTTRVGIGAPGFGYGYQWWTYDDGSFAARGIFGQGIFIDPARRLVVAVNSNWTSAGGGTGGERQRREEFYRAVQAAADGGS